jgi:hypothetical protein
MWPPESTGGRSLGDEHEPVMLGEVAEVRDIKRRQRHFVGQVARGVPRVSGVRHQAAHNGTTPHQYSTHSRRRRFSTQTGIAPGSKCCISWLQPPIRVTVKNVLPAFQAGHVSSIPVARSRLVSLASTRADTVLACGFLTRHVRPPYDEHIEATLLGIADELTRDGSSLPGRGNRQGLTNLPMSGSWAPVYPCVCLHIANVGGARQFSLMCFLSDAPCRIFAQVGVQSPTVGGHADCTIRGILVVCDRRL